jgi:hypothetical protein
VNPGPASTIYRGLAAVNVAGVIVSMVFSIVLLPSLMRLIYERQAPKIEPAIETDGAELSTETSR